MLQRMRSKKGFTLAELLIVVAIIAILVAIAVPLFVGALNQAEARVLDANKRAVRAAAVEEILMNKEAGTDNDLLQKKDGDTVTFYKAWGVKAYINASGEVTYMKITPQGGTTADEAYEALIRTHSETNCKKLSSKTTEHVGADKNGVAGGYYIELIIKELTLSHA